MNDFDIVSIRLSTQTEEFAYRTPMKFGGRVVRDVSLVHVSCAITNRVGQSGLGLGSMTMGVAWAWPSKQLDSSQTLSIIVELADDLVRSLNAICGDGAQTPEFLASLSLQDLEVTCEGHPMRICHSLRHLLDKLAERLQKKYGLSEPIPPLARLLAASPLQAAIFDAHGKAAEMSSFAMLGPEFLEEDLSAYLGSEFSGKRLNQFVLATPAAEMPLYHLVGALDPLDSNELETSIDDGLPNTLLQWIQRDGLTHLKIKLDGADVEWDLTRILRVNEIASQAIDGRKTKTSGDFQFSLDFNERCENEEYLLRLFDRLEAKSPVAFSRIAYVEQPTHRDLHLHPHNTMHRVAARLPVVIDESLIDYESLLLAREQGYSGVAIKACKGHADALLMAAAAQHHKMFLCVQDLTCVGISFLHSASLTAHLPGAAAIEGNGRQYCPAANTGWEEKFPGMFEVRGGRLPTAQLAGPGLGY